MALYLGDEKCKVSYTDGAYIPNFYKSSKFYAYGNRYTSVSGNIITPYDTLSMCYGGSSCSIFALDNTGYTYMRDCIGNKTYNTSTYLEPAIYKTDKTMRKFTECISTSTSTAYVLRALGIDSLKECKSVTYYFMFKQSTYDGDVLLRPFIARGNHVSSLTSGILRSKVLYSPSDYDSSPTYSYSFLNNYKDTSSGFMVTYPESAKGSYMTWGYRLNDSEIDRINSVLTMNFVYYLRFLCKAFRLDGGTETVSDVTAYFGGYLVFEL